MEQFNSLTTDGFVDGEDTTHRRHAKQPVHAMLLSVPPIRRTFVSGQPRSCFLALEHYYPDALLEQFGLKGEPVVADSAVFNILSKSKKKTEFAEASRDFGTSEFANFKALFDWIIQLFGVKVESDSNPNPNEQVMLVPSMLGGQAAQLPLDVQAHTIFAGIEIPLMNDSVPELAVVEETTADESHADESR